MIFKIKRQSTQFARFIWWAQGSFLLIGILALTYCAVVLNDRSNSQAYQSRQFERALKDARKASQGYPQLKAFHRASEEEGERARSESSDAKIRAGSPIGRIEIASIGLAAMVMEGIDGKTLGVAVGHIPSTPLPGQQGNVGLAAHRDNFFRGLRNIHKDDEINLTTLLGAYHYRVDSTQVVDPGDLRVLAPTSGDFLTLVTCYPFYFVGPAPERFIVRAHLTSE
jgi:sortase A